MPDLDPAGELDQGLGNLFRRAVRCIEDGAGREPIKGPGAALRVGADPLANRLFEELLSRFTTVSLAGPVEWTRSNRHTGIRHMKVRLGRA